MPSLTWPVPRTGPRSSTACSVPSLGDCHEVSPRITRTTRKKNKRNLFLMIRVLRVIRGEFCGEQMMRKPPGPEEALLRQVLKLARLTGWLTFHTRAARTAHGWRTSVQGDGKGFPDLVLLHPRRALLVFVELKSDRGRLTADQRRWFGTLHLAGQRVLLWRPCLWPHIEGFLKGVLP